MIEYILFVLGFAFLVEGANLLIDGSIVIANKLKISRLVIGLTIIAFGTSLPELVVNLFASSSDSSGVALGNIIGSNIANILFILGVASIISVIKFRKTLVQKQMFFAALAAISLLLLTAPFMSGGITIFSGVLMLLLFVIFLIYTVKSGGKDFKTKPKKEYKPLITVILLILGLAMLYFGGQWTVNGAILIAKQIGISEYLISITVVAIGTSLPELVTSIIALIKKEADIAIGNVIGSNIANTFFVLAISAIIHPIQTTMASFVDSLALVIATALLFLVITFNKGNSLRRWHGILFLALYVAYIIFLLIR